MHKGKTISNTIWKGNKMSCKKELDIGCPQVTIIAIEWIFFSEDRKWIELKIRQNSTAKFNQFSWQKLICKIQVWQYSVSLCFFLTIQGMILPIINWEISWFFTIRQKSTAKFSSYLITETQNLSLKISIWIFFTFFHWKNP